LATNNPDIIRSRISTNHTAPQAAQVIEIATPNIHHTFGANGWAHPLTDIEIFDIYFLKRYWYYDGILPSDLF
jgi:hypothetical protein